MMRPGSVTIVLCIALGACSETSMLQYQGRPAETALECDAAYELSRKNGAAVPIGASGPAIAGGVIGTGIATGMREEQYKTCLARVAALPGGTLPRATGSVASVTPRPVTATSRPAAMLPSSGCGSSTGVFQGGTGYCLGK